MMREQSNDDERPTVYISPPGEIWVPMAIARRMTFARPVESDRVRENIATERHYHVYYAPDPHSYAPLAIPLFLLGFFFAALAVYLWTIC